MKKIDIHDIQSLKDFSIKNNNLQINNQSIKNIVSKFKTPFYLYDSKIIEKNYNKIKNTFKKFNIFFSIKANSSITLLKLLSNLGCGAECASMGEIKLALCAGIPAQSIVFAGPAKTYEELEFAIKTNIRSLNVESFNELQRINNIGKKLNKKIEVSIRFNTKTKANTQEVMIGENSKFGIDAKKVFENFDYNNFKFLKIKGIHYYIASGIDDEDLVLENLEAILQIGQKLEKKLGHKIEIIDFGGGLNITNKPNFNSINYENLKKGMKIIYNKYNDFISDKYLIIELGRSLIANSGIFVTSIIDIKDSGSKQFIMTDGGMNNFLRPIFMNANHPIFILNKLNLKNTKRLKYDIGGPICTPIDIFGKDIDLPEAQINDIIGIFNAGAYGYSMSIHEFLGHNSPIEILAHKEKLFKIREKITLDDRLLKQFIPPELF